MKVLEPIQNDASKWRDTFAIRRLQVPESKARNCMKLEFLLDEMLSYTPQDYNITWGTVLKALEEPYPIVDSIGTAVRQYLSSEEVYGKYNV